MSHKDGRVVLSAPGDKESRGLIAAAGDLEADVSPPAGWEHGVELRLAEAAVVERAEQWVDAVLAIGIHVASGEPSNARRGQLRRDEEVAGARLYEAVAHLRDVRAKGGGQ